MLPPTALEATRRRSTASSDAEKTVENDARSKNGPQKSVMRTAEVPDISAQRSRSPMGSTSRDDSSQQRSRDSPSREVVEMARRSGPGFDRGVRKFDDHTPKMFGNKRNGNDFIHKPLNCETLDNRGRSAERHTLNDRPTRFSQSQERSQLGEAYNQVGHHRYYGDLRHWTDIGYDDSRSRFENQVDRRPSRDCEMLKKRRAIFSPSRKSSQHYDVNDDINYVRERDHYRRTNNNPGMGTDSLRRPSSLGRYNENSPSISLYYQDNYENYGPSHGFSGSSPLCDRRLKTEERRSDHCRPDTYECVQRPQLFYAFSYDEPSCFYPDQSRRRRSQSVGRYVDHRRSKNTSTRGNFEELQHRRQCYEMPRFIERYVHPFIEGGNRYDESRYYVEADENKVLQNRILLENNDRFDYDRYAPDRN